MINCLRRYEEKLPFVAGFEILLWCIEAKILTSFHFIKSKELPEKLYIPQFE